jgi:SAM-dependent methyltransferase
MNVVERLHAGYIHGRRLRVLAAEVARLIPRNARVLDVGAGDGRLAKLVGEARPDVAMHGIDVLVRDATHIPVDAFDGQVIPFADGSVDAILLIDVLHHTTDPMGLLREAARVSRGVIVIKDHTRDGFLAGSTLRLMDRVGNARHGVALPYSYWPKRQWLAAIDALGLRIGEWRSALGLYPPPLSWIFERSLHFIATIYVKSATRAPVRPGRTGAPSLPEGARRA